MKIMDSSCHQEDCRQKSSTSVLVTMCCFLASAILVYLDIRGPGIFCIVHVDRIDHRLEIFFDDIEVVDQKDHHSRLCFHHVLMNTMFLSDIFQTSLVCHPSRNP